MIYLSRGKSKHKSKNFLASICTCVCVYVCVYVCMCTSHIFPLEGGIMADFYFLFCVYLDFPKLVVLTFFLSLQLERKKCSKKQSTFRYYNGAGKRNGLTLTMGC